MRALASLLIVSLCAAPLQAEISTVKAAAILVFPCLRVDDQTDTRIRIANTDSRDPLGVRCRYEDGVNRREFTLTITARQPLEWLVSQGLSEFPLDGIHRVGPQRQSNQGSLIPPVRTRPFSGALRCVATDDDFPVARNALIGTATVELESEVTQYNAIGIPAASEGNMYSDFALLLGGPNAEYAACPQSVMLDHFFDGAAYEAAGTTATVFTAVSLVPCGETVPALIDVEVFNEFEQRLGATFNTPAIGLVQLSALDTDMPEQSIFHIAVQGTLVGQSYFRAHQNEGAILMAAIETHHNATGDQLAAVSPQSLGEQNSQEVMLFAGAQVPATRTPTHTAAATTTPTVKVADCPGDCDSNGAVTVDEIIRCVHMALGLLSVAECPVCQCSDDPGIGIDCLVTLVNNALSGCPS